MWDFLNALGVLVIVAVVIGALSFLRGSWDEMKAYRAQNLDEQPRRKWFFSGIALGDKNFRSDAGGVFIDKYLTRDEAIAKVSELFQRASVVHVDDLNGIITYQVSS